MSSRAKGRGIIGLGFHTSEISKLLLSNPHPLWTKGPLSNKGQKKNIQNVSTHRNGTSKRLESTGEKTNSVIRSSWPSLSLSQLPIWIHMEMLGSLDLSFRKVMVLKLKCCWQVVSRANFNSFPIPHVNIIAPLLNHTFIFIFLFYQVFIFEIISKQRTGDMKDSPWYPTCSGRDKKEYLLNIDWIEVSIVRPPLMSDTKPYKPVDN